MKRLIALVLACLMLTTFFVSCKKEDPNTAAPDAAGIGKKGETETTKVQGSVDQNGPNEQLPDWTTRYGE